MKIFISIRYTPNYPGAKRVNRQHYFDTEQEKNDFLKRMFLLYPDTQKI